MIIPAVIVSSSKTVRLNMILSLVKQFTYNPLNVTGALFLSDLFEHLVDNNSAEPEKIVNVSIEITRNLYKKIDENSGIIFDLEFNPEILLKSVKLYLEIFEMLENERSIEKAEDIICSVVNESEKSGIKRATVNNPVTIIPFAVFISKIFKEDPGNLLFYAARLGGAASALASISGAISAGIYGKNAVPDNLVSRLANRKKIVKALDDLVDNKISEKYIDDYLISEAALTEKELDEYDSKLKLKKEKKKKRSKLDKKTQLNNHIVESWTKADQSRWKKSIRKGGKNKK